MSFRLTPAMSTALRSGQHPIVPLVKVQLPSHTLCHMVGSGEVVWGSDKFVGVDPTFGMLVSAGNIEDGITDEAPEWQLTFVPPGGTSAATLTSAMAQGGQVSGWLAVIDRTTGTLIPDPIQVFAGELDVARLRVGKGTRTVEWRCVSALEVFHDGETGARLSDAWHKLVWPGETGLANMSGIEKVSFWGVEKGQPSVTYASGTTAASFAALLK